jgi:cobalt-zinc-cadmium efflux system outer membrane protein
MTAGARPTRIPGPGTLRRRAAALAALSICLLAPDACRFRRYEPAPITPAGTADSLEARRLDNPALRDFIRENLGNEPEPWPPTSWNPALLTLAAFFYHPDIDTARAEVEGAEAAVITAGARPNPGLDTALGRGSPAENPWLFIFDFLLPVETAGKRGHRIAAAAHLAGAARLQLAEAGWQVRSRLRAALLSFFVARRRLELLQGEETLRAEVAELLGRRFDVGEASRPDLDTARIALSRSRAAAWAAEAGIGEARAAVASAIGISVSALEGVEPAWDEFDRPPDPDSLPTAGIRRSAVLNRLDVRRGLAEYEAAESELRLEIAKQYPDIRIGPGYEYDTGENKFTIGLSFSLPLFNRNQGPIAEAEARRRKAAAQFLGLQARVIGESEKALAGYNGAAHDLYEVDTALVAVQDRKERAARKAFEIGESDRLAWTDARLEAVLAASARLDALERAQQALGALEDAVQQPLSPAWRTPRLPVPGQSPD